MSIELGGSQKPATGSRFYLVALAACGLILLSILAGYFIHLSRTTITPHAQGQATLNNNPVSDVSTISVGGIDDARWRLLVGSADGTYKQPTDTPSAGTFAEFECSYHGNTLDHPPAYITFQIVESLGQFEHEISSRDLTFLVDGQSFASAIVESRRGYAVAHLSVDQAISIAHAKSAEIDAGELQYKLTDYQLQGLRDLLKTIGD